MQIQEIEGATPCIVGRFAVIALPGRVGECMSNVRIDVHDVVFAQPLERAAEGVHRLNLDAPVFRGEQPENWRIDRPQRILVIGDVAVVDHSRIEIIAKDNIRAAYSFIELSTGAPRIASLGWCFGGMWSLNTAMLFPN
ncbi:MAG: hypothetical protein AAFN50_11180, partial [Pseudomonadota bacterium]